MADPSRSVSVEELQEAVATAVRWHGLTTDPAARMLDLVSEVGELAKELLESTAYGGSALVPRLAWAEELGDVAFSLFALADATATAVEPAVHGAIAKIDRRVAETGSASSGGMPDPV